MKRQPYVYLSIILSLLFLSACSPSYEMVNNYVEGQDFQHSFLAQGSSRTMAENETGYYFLVGSYLYYADKATMKPVILCNKPNCLHDEETDSAKKSECNAYFPMVGYGGNLAYLDNDLYVLEDNDDETRTANLVRVSEDGTKREAVIEFEYEPEHTILHRGKIYISSSIYPEDGEIVYGVYEYDISKGISQKPKEVYVGSLDNGSIQGLLCYGDNLYFWEHGFLNDSSIIQQHMRYDMKKDVVSSMLKSEENTFPGRLSFMKDKLYSSFAIMDMGTGKVLETNNYQFSLDGTDQKISLKTDIYITLSSDGEYLYTDDIKWSPFSKPRSEQEFSVYNTDGEELVSIKTDTFSDSSEYLGAGKDHIFYSSSTEESYQIYYADKSTIPDGKLEFKLFFETNTSGDSSEITG